MKKEFDKRFDPLVQKLTERTGHDGDDSDGRKPTNAADSRSPTKNMRSTKTPASKLNAYRDAAPETKTKLLKFVVKGNLGSNKWQPAIDTLKTTHKLVLPTTTPAATAEQIAYLLAGAGIKASEQLLCL